MSHLAEAALPNGALQLDIVKLDLPAARDSMSMLGCRKARQSRLDTLSSRIISNSSWWDTATAWKEG